MIKGFEILLLVVLLAVLIALSCNPDPIVFGWFEKTFDLFDLNSPAVRSWIIYHPKLWHVVSYFSLTLISLILFRPYVWGTVLSVFFVGVLLEIAQLFVPTRTARMQDLLFNLAGICLALLGVSIVRKLKKMNSGKYILTGG